MDPNAFTAPGIYIGTLDPVPTQDFDTFLKLDGFSKA